MSIDLTLLQTNASGPLLPSRLAMAFTQLAKLPGRAQAPNGTMRGQELRLALALSLDDDACAAFMLDFGGQGHRVRGAAHGPSSTLLSWAFHALAASLKCTLHDADAGQDVDTNPEAHRAAALAYLADYEAEVRANQRKGVDEGDGDAFLSWLVREEHIALAEDAGALGTTLPMDDASALYEMLLESDAVEDVFVSETELTALLARFRARTTSRR
jgi:hypothetical protein